MAVFSRNSEHAIGHADPRHDAAAKVAGREQYASDYYPGHLLWLGVRRSDQVHARLRGIDTAVAAQVPGVVAVLTHRDIRGTNRVGLPEWDEPVLCDDKVRHRGDALALVLAESNETLREALPRVRVDYEILEPVLDPERALEPGSPRVHEDAPHGNILLQGEITTGDGAAALAACDVVARGSFALSWQEHAYLETECGVAWMEADGTLVIVASTQTPFRDRIEVAASLGLEQSKVRIIAPHLGGGFGGKDGITVQALLGLAALHSGGRPVKLVNSREESFLSSTKRHPARVAYEAGCKDGALYALKCRILLDTGPYNCLGTAVLALAIEHAGGVYRFPHASIEGHLVYTNNPIGGAFRGFGVPQVIAGLEQVIDDLAGKLGQDPVEFRLRNVFRRGDRTACGATMTETVGTASCLESLRRHPLWAGRETWTAAAPRFKRRGVGVACALHGMGYGPVVPDSATAKIELGLDGAITVYIGVADMGQGNAATFLQITGALLNQRPENLRAVMPDTARTLPSGSSSASRTTFTYGNALVPAAETLKQRILQRALLLAHMTTMSEVAEGELALLPDGVCHLPSGRTFPLSAIAQTMDAAERCCTSSYIAPAARQVVGASRTLRSWGLPHRVFSFAAHLALVEVDELTGETTVCRYLACTEAGRTLNPQVYEQQVQGGVAQGLGYALFEEFQVERGEIRTGNLTTYTLPTALDVPEVESLRIEPMEAQGPFGMKGVGEVVIDPVYAAVANAVARAVGAHVQRGPLTPERILPAMVKRSPG